MPSIPATTEQHTRDVTIHLITRPRDAPSSAEDLRPGLTADRQPASITLLPPSFSAVLTRAFRAQVCGTCSCSRFPDGSRTR